MTSGVESVGAISGAVLYRPVAAPAQQAATVRFSSNLSSVSPVSSSNADASFTPRIIQDPSAGFITQYLSANGSEVISQSPSAITVAYLRQGLTAEGTSKASAYLPPGTIA